MYCHAVWPVIKRMVPRSSGRLGFSGGGHVGRDGVVGPLISRDKPRGGSGGGVLHREGSFLIGCAQRYFVIGPRAGPALIGWILYGRNGVLFGDWSRSADRGSTSSLLSLLRFVPFSSFIMLLTSSSGHLL